MEEAKIQPIILAGGLGQRLWPLSNETQPKQFLSPLAHSNSMMQETIQRLPKDAKLLAPIIVTHEQHYYLAREQANNVNPNCTFILEPSSHNTAPAIAMAAHLVAQSAPQTILLVLPADHYIESQTKLLLDIDNAYLAAIQDLIICFGAHITSVQTGYGHIECGAAVAGTAAKRIKKFIEKPNFENASRLSKQPNMLWNSGMFMFKAGLIIQELTKYHPEIIANVTAAWRHDNEDRAYRPSAAVYNKCQSISIDHAVMEHTEHAAVVALQSSWSDIGSWQMVWQQSPKDSASNVKSGDVVLQNTTNCLVQSHSRLVATSDISDLAIIETDNAILISKLSESQNIKPLLEQITANPQKPAINSKVLRPWGWFTTIYRDANVAVKKLLIKPKHSISLQYHNHRSEHWVVVAGIATVRCGDKLFALQLNQSTFIPKGTKHKLSNETNEDLVIIEVQTGSYLGEDDIIRLSDEYGRAKTETSIS